MSDSPYTPEFFLYHKTGPTLRATFSDADMAETWWRGNRGLPSADYFYITNAAGERITFQRNRYGHASAILDALSTQLSTEED